MTTITASAPNRLLREQIVQLRRHLAQCSEARGRWFSTALAGEYLHDVLAPRFVTTVALASLVLAVTCGWA